MPSRTLRNWFQGQDRFEPALRMSEPRSGFLSLADLAEAFVLATIRREHELSLQSIRKALAWLRSHTRRSHPLSALPLLTDGESLLIEAFGEYVNATRHGQLEWRALVEPCLQRIERARDGSLVRLYPFSRSGQPVGDKSIVIDPRVQFGRPCLAGTGVPTAVLFDRWSAGDSPEDLARDYEVPVEAVNEALRFETRDARPEAA